MKNITKPQTKQQQLVLNLKLIDIIPQKKRSAFGPSWDYFSLEMRVFCS